MSYQDRLRLKISADVPEAGATKVSKGAFVPFVAGLSAPLRQISAVHNLLIATGTPTRWRVSTPFALLELVERHTVH